MFQRIMVALLRSTSLSPAKKYGGYAQNVDTLGLPKLSNVPTDKVALFVEKTKAVANKYYQR